MNVLLTYSFGTPFGLMYTHAVLLCFI